MKLLHGCLIPLYVTKFMIKIIYTHYIKERRIYSQKAKWMYIMFSLTVLFLCLVYKYIMFQTIFLSYIFFIFERM